MAEPSSPNLSAATDGPGLLTVALHLRDTAVLAMASSGPTQSIATSLAVIILAVAYAGFLPIVAGFVPMLGIALGLPAAERLAAECGCHLLLTVEAGLGAEPIVAGGV